MESGTSLHLGSLRLYYLKCDRGLALDSFGTNIRKAVRTTACFGQLWAYCTKSCTNSGLLRTALGLMHEKLAELVAASDSFGATTRNAVRTTSYFGQLWGYYSKSWPNFGLLRTT